MTIAIKVELKEDWGGNCPEVLVIAKSRRRGGGNFVTARLTPQTPVAEVCITRDQDLYFEVVGASANTLDDGKVDEWRHRYRSTVTGKSTLSGGVEK